MRVTALSLLLPASLKSGVAVPIYQVTKKHKDDLITLDLNGDCRGGSSFKTLEEPSGHSCDNVDLFCVGMTFMPRIEAELNLLVTGRRFQRKAKRSANPSLRGGELRCWERYAIEDSAGTAFDISTLSSAGDAGIAACPETAAAGYTVDPLSRLSSGRAEEAMQIRSEYVEQMRPNSVPEEYLCFRAATKQLGNC